MVDLRKLWQLQFWSNIAAMFINAINQAAVKIKGVTGFADNSFDQKFFSGKEVKIDCISIAEIHVFNSENNDVVPLDQMGVEIKMSQFEGIINAEVCFGDGKPVLLFECRAHRPCGYFIKLEPCLPDQDGDKKSSTDAEYEVAHLFEHIFFQVNLG